MPGGVLAALACVTTVGAQEARTQDGDTLVVTLEQALDVALRNNPAYLRAANGLRLNGPESRAAWITGILPSLDLTLFQSGYAGNLQRRATDDFGNPISNPNPEYVYYSSTTQGLGLTWQLSGFSPWHRLQRLGAENGERVLGEELAGERLRLEVHRRFFAAREQEELLEIERAAAGASRLDLDAAERLFSLALRSRVDVLQAELAIEQRHIALRERESARGSARLALAELLGRRTLPDVKPALTELPVFDPAGLDEEALVEAALRSSAPVRRADAALRTAEIAVAESRGIYWPRLTASVRVGRLAQAPNTGSLFDLGGFDDERYGTFALGVSLPFFNDPLVNQATVARARVARDGRDEARREARLASERGTRAALLKLRNRWDETRIRERALSSAAEALALAREEYRLGTRTFELLQQAVREELDQRRMLVQTRYGFVEALIDLEEAVGEPVR